MATLAPVIGEWYNTISIKQYTFQCGFCGDMVGANKGYVVESAAGGKDGGRTNGWAAILICPSCNRPTFMDNGWQTQSPSPILGREVKHLPKDVERLYSEVRSCTQVGAYTSCILGCRKLLMHIAVEQGAPPGDQFVKYVNYLVDNHLVPQNAKPWVTHIKDKGNEANHEIVYATGDEAAELLRFVEMMLSFMYEYAAPPMGAKAASNP